MYRKIFMIITAAAAWSGLIIQLYILVSNTPQNGMTVLQAIGRFFLFFTILSNILVAVSLSSDLISPGSVTGRFFSKSSVIAAITLYIFIVGVVYNLVLRSIWEPVGVQKIADELLHVIVPVLYTIYWLCYASKHSLRWTHSVSWLLFPSAYLVYAMTRGYLEGYYAYPFLDLNSHTTGRVIINILLMLFAFTGAGLLLIAIGRSFKKPVNS